MVLIRRRAQGEEPGNEASVMLLFAMDSTAISVTHSSCVLILGGWVSTNPAKDFPTKIYFQAICSHKRNTLCCKFLG